MPNKLKATICCGFLTLLPALAANGDPVLLEMTMSVRNGCGAARIEFYRSYPDGTASAEPFRVPEGKLMVVTDVDWYYHTGNAGTTQILRLLVENLADATLRRRAFESLARLDAVGVGGASERMTTGFAISSKARLCLEVLPGPFIDPPRLSRVLVRGYFKDEL